MDAAKVKDINEWEPPSKVPELRSFLGQLLPTLHLCLFRYRRSSHRHAQEGEDMDMESRMSTSLRPPKVKEAITKEGVLSLPDLSKPFELDTDASYLAIGGVLMQEGHPIAFESRKLNDREKRYAVEEKEMTAVRHCLRTWRPTRESVRHQDGQGGLISRQKRSSLPSRLDGRISWRNSTIHWSTKRDQLPCRCP